MAKTDAQRGAFGAWARAQRVALLEADLASGAPRKSSIWSSADKAQPEIERRTGHRMRADYLRGIESGNQLPGPETVDALERAYGTKAPPVRSEASREPGADLTAVVAAIDRQTATLAALVEELRSARVPVTPTVVPPESSTGAGMAMIAWPQFIQMGRRAAGLTLSDLAANVRGATIRDVESWEAGRGTPRMRQQGDLLALFTGAKEPVKRRRVAERAAG